MEKARYRRGCKTLLPSITASEFWGHLLSESVIYVVVPEIR